MLLKESDRPIDCTVRLGGIAIAARCGVQTVVGNTNSSAPHAHSGTVSEITLKMVSSAQRKTQRAAAAVVPAAGLW